MGILEQFSLSGKTAMITGGARGIGKSAAAALCEAGANVVLADLDLDEAERTAAALQAHGTQVEAVRCDVTSPKDVDGMMSRIVARYSGLDIAFCNAGICINAPAAEMTYAQWKQILDVNLTGVFLTAQAAGKQMIRQGGGVIINTASMSGHIVNVPQPQCAYNASKAGVIQLTKSLAVEWAPYHVRVNSISPGYIGTELVLASPPLVSLIKQWESVSPLGRIGRPEELQTTILYLASDASSFTTGADFIVDGAFTCV